ncbi:hypothetical protein WA026_007499 [Henosepilachna vigintioctopunctata]|uniref:Transposase n=1 Tax=Henosepilachna vigintioctopunctata TaxID=420089 RepID=A0AAW1UXU6_9CUCU
MPKIPDQLAFGLFVKMMSSILVDNFNYCECCGLETIRQLRITKGRTLSNLFPKNKTAPAASQNLFDDFQVDNEQLTLIEDSLMTDDVSSDKEKKQLISVSRDFISLEEEEKKTYQMAGRPPKKRKYSSRFSTEHQPPRTNYVYLALSNNTIQVSVHSVGSIIYECVHFT